MLKTKLTKQERTRLILRFCQALSKIKNPEEAAAFVTDLLSESESEMLAKRLEIAEKLIAGDSYDKICENLKTSHGTVARVCEWLKLSGSGYRTIIERLEKTPEIKYGKMKLSAMERKYPAYYWPQILLKQIVANASKRQKEQLEKTLSQFSTKTQLYRELSDLLKPRSLPKT